MIPLNDEYADVVLAELTHLAAKVQGSLKVTAVTIVKVAGDEYELNFFPNRQIDHIVEGRARRISQPRGCSVVLIEIELRAIQVDIRRMQELEHGLPSPLESSQTRSLMNCTSVPFRKPSEKMPQTRPDIVVCPRLRCEM